MSLAHIDTETGEVLTSATGPLALIEQSAALLAEAESLDEVASIRDRAEALRILARKAHLSLDVANRAAELKLRAERKAGVLLADMPKNPGGRSTSVTVPEVGVNHSQSSRWQRIASIPESDFDALIADAFLGGKELTSASALKLAKRLAVTPVTEAALHTIYAEDGEELLDAYPTIVIDPPWRYDNVATRGAAEDHYETMSLDELAAMTLRSADSAHLYLWVTNGFLREGFGLIDAWGFTYKACLTWCKPQIGMGNWFRNTTEHVLFGVRGKCPTLRNDVPTHFVADRTRHSAKPESFYDLVERCSPGPWLDMFSRNRRRFGWHCMGAEAA